MTVWVLTYRCYDDDEVVGVFSDFERAKAVGTAKRDRIVDHMNATLGSGIVKRDWREYVPGRWILDGEYELTEHAVQ